MVRTGSPWRNGVGGQWGAGACVADGGGVAALESAEGNGAVKGRE